MKISVVTAVFNARETVADSIESVLNQSHPDIELIVIDGASTDGTSELLESYRQCLAIFISESDRGIYDALNKGIAQASGEVVGFLHADDLYANHQVLAKISQAFEDRSVDAVYGDLVYVNKSAPDQVIRYWQAGAFNPDNFRWGWMPPHPTFYVRRSVYERFGLFSLDLGTAADYEIMLRFLLKHRTKTVYIPEVLVHMRVGGASNASLKARLVANRNDHRAWEINGLRPYPWTIALKPIRKIPQFFIKKTED